MSATATTTNTTRTSATEKDHARRRSSGGPTQRRSSAGGPSQSYLLREKYNAEVKKNEELREKTQAAQDKYLALAEERLMCQRTMSKIYLVIAESEWRMKSNKQGKDKNKVNQIVQDVYALNEGCIGRARVVLDTLEDATNQDMDLTKQEEAEAMLDMSASSQIEDMTGQFHRQNRQLQRDWMNREAYFKGETRIKADFDKAIEKAVQLLEDNCNDEHLVEQVMKMAHEPHNHV